MPQSVWSGKAVEAFFQRIEALGLLSRDRLYTGKGCLMKRRDSAPTARQLLF